MNAMSEAEIACANGLVNLATWLGALAGRGNQAGIRNVGAGVLARRPKVVRTIRSRSSEVRAQRPANLPGTEDRT